MDLAIDTSTGIASLGLFEEGSMLAEMTWKASQNHGCQLLPNLLFLLNLAKQDVKSIQGISVAKGPGSYNGLRVGISTVKGLALALGVKVVAVSTLEVEAYPFAGTGLPVYALQKAGGGQIAVACYKGGSDGGWERLVEEHITTLDVLCSHVGEKAIFCGELSPAVSVQLKTLLGEKAILPGEALRTRRASFLAELGRLRRKKGEFDDLATLQPAYLRSVSVTPPRKEFSGVNFTPPSTSVS